MQTIVGKIEDISFSGVRYALNIGGQHYWGSPPLRFKKGDNVEVQFDITKHFMGKPSNEIVFVKLVGTAKHAKEETEEFESDEVEPVRPRKEHAHDWCYPQGDEKVRRVCFSCGKKQEFETWKEVE